MAVDDFLDCMPDTVAIAPFVSVDSYGNRTFGAGVNYSAKISGKTAIVKTASGEEKASTKRIYLGSSVVIGASDEVTLPASHVPQKPPILAVTPVTDESGQHHSVIFI